MKKNYRSSFIILQTLYNKINDKPNGVNGFIVLMHLGTDPKRKDKLYNYLPEVIQLLKAKGYQLVTVTELLQEL